MDEIVIPKNRATDAVLDALIRNYPGLKVGDCKKGESLRLLTDGFAPEQTQHLGLDVRFLLDNPNVPLENLCSRVDNYLPTNESQVEILTYAMALINMKDLSIPQGCSFMANRVQVKHTWR